MIGTDVLRMRKTVHLYDTDTITLGMRGENEVEAVDFVISEWIEEFGDGDLTISVRRHDDEAPYLVHPVVSDGIAAWELTVKDTCYTGLGSVQLIYAAQGQIKKSKVFATRVIASNDRQGPVPNEWQTYIDWILQEVGKVTGMRAVSETLPIGTPAYARYENGVLYIGIPTGGGGSFPVPEEPGEYLISYDGDTVTYESYPDSAWVDHIDAPVEREITLHNRVCSVFEEPISTMILHFDSPTEGLDYNCGIIFRAVENFQLSVEPPPGFSCKWCDVPIFETGKVYEVSFRCLWMHDTGGNYVISARFAEAAV